MASSSLGSTHCSTTTQPLYTATTSTGDTALDIRIEALKLHSSFPYVRFGYLSIISKIDKRWGIIGIWKIWSFLREEPHWSLAPALPARAVMTPASLRHQPEASRAWQSRAQLWPQSAQFPFSNFCHASTSFSYFDSYLLKRLPMVSDCSSGFYNLQRLMSRSCDIWKLLINICTNSLQYLHSTHAARQLIWTFSQPCHVLHCHIKTTPCPCRIPMAFCHDLFLSFSEIHLINEWMNFNFAK